MFHWKNSVESCTTVKQSHLSKELKCLCLTFKDLITINKFVTCASCNGHTADPTHCIYYVAQQAIPLWYSV